MKATRAASQDELATSALKRLDALIAEGATTVEVIGMETPLPSIVGARP